MNTVMTEEKDYELLRRSDARRSIVSLVLMHEFEALASVIRGSLFMCRESDCMCETLFIRHYSVLEGGVHA